MANSLCLTEKEYPTLFEKLNKLFEPQNNDDKDSFRLFCSKLLHEICDSKLPQNDIPRQDNSVNLGKQ